jgi:hypothetical protein
MLHLWSTDKIIESNGGVAVQVGQSVGVDRLLLLHDGSYHWTQDGLADHLGRLRLQQTPDGHVAVHSLQVGVVTQHLVGQVLGYLLVNVG